MQKLFFILILCISRFTFATEKNEFFEALTPQEKQYLEYGIEESELPSLCSQTNSFATNPIWNNKQPITKVDLVLIDKKRRLLHLIDEGNIQKSYRIALGGNPTGDKVSEGDLRTPEGMYFFEAKNKRSDYYLSLKINYPNAQDIKDSLKKGIKDPGKDIMVHGLPNSWVKRKFIRHPKDWTKGCIAVTNYEIQEIFSLVQLGTLVEICP